MSAYIKLSTQEYPRHIGDIQIDPAGAADYAHVEWVDAPSFDPDTQHLAQGSPIQQNNVWIMTWVVSQIPEADRGAWADYRQALRDVTQQSGFPWTIDWPVAP